MVIVHEALVNLCEELFMPAAGVASALECDLHLGDQLVVALRTGKWLLKQSLSQALGGFSVERWSASVCKPLKDLDAFNQQV